MSKHAMKFVSSAVFEAMPAPAAAPVPVRKASIWARVKATTVTVAKTVGAAMAVPFKAVARFVKRVPLPLPVVVWDAIDSTKAAVKAVGRFTAKNWGWMLSAAILAPALIIAPIPTLVGAALIAASWQMYESDSRLVRVMGRVLVDVGAQVIANGIVDALEDRR